jgi:putative ABC transport system ATP-binding protein
MQQRFSVDKKPIISVIGISKSFEQGGDTLHILKDVHFEAYPGELVMIVGPSGSGKTTLLSAIAGTLSVNQGSISLSGFCLQEKTEEEILRFRSSYIGFIFQQFNLIPTLTCAENVAIPLFLNGWAYEKALEEAIKGLESVGLASKAPVSPKLLSGGQQQRVAIARALIHQPKIIICDEPTSALDSETGTKIMELILSHAKDSGRVVILVTHDSRILKYATRIVKMEDGKIINQQDKAYDA